MKVIVVLELDTTPGAARRWVEHDPSTPLLTATDFGATRGDGVFETILVLHGVPQAMEAHLDRFARSAQLLDLPVPDRTLWRDAISAAADRLRDHPRAAVKYVCTRGNEATGGTPTGWLTAFVPSTRTEGGPPTLRVVALDRGYRSDVATTSPWLLQGAKTLSYALNMAALREAGRRGADDVVFVSSDGLVLEGPTSTVIARFDGVYTTPPVELGILPGTTQHDVFAALRGRGESVAVRPFTLDELRGAEAIWLCSSTRGAAPVGRLDGETRTVDAAMTTTINAALDARGN